MSDESSGLLGVVAGLVSIHRTKKELRRIQKSNVENQGVVRYQPSNIEAFFNDSDPVDNIILSGGLSDIRSRAISRAIECGYFQGYNVVVLHCANRELENRLLTYCGNQNVCVINNQNPIYDPFWGLSNSEISRLIISSAGTGYEINPLAKYYIDGVSSFIRSKGIKPYSRMYMNCPYLTLVEKINEAESKNIISSDDAKSIIAQIMQGEVERGNIENFFSVLESQANNIIASRSLLNHAINVEVAFQRKQIFTIDIQSNANSLIISMLVSEIERMMMKGFKTLLVVDGIQLSVNDSLQSLLKKSGTNCGVILSGEDVYSSFGGDENSFISFLGKCSQVVLSKHTSSYTCQKWSDYIGFFDKQEVTNTFSHNANYIGKWGLGDAQTVNVNVKRENIVKSEFINRMSANEVYVVNKTIDEVSFAKII